ncbi:hypothetical protein ABNG02_16375 [Halorubrum ejinorense]|uniref:DUF7982 domain-containing protein n=1 Tax=Halorubrum ejinorense TaxID=425309 RepID=A0AAV3SU19_9EURY
MSAPNANNDDAEAVEQLNRGGDPTTTLRSANTEETRKDGHVPSGSTDEADSFNASERITELETLVDVLKAENERLRTDYARARAVTYRETALALAVIGLVAVLGGVALPDVRAVLFVTGAIGLFGGTMTWYLTPERVVPISVSESVYDGAMTTLTDLKSELGLQPVTVYVPVGDQTRGFIPRDSSFETPESLSHVFPDDASGSEGITFTPTGQQMTREVDEIRTTQAPETTLGAVEQVADSLVEHFEVADQITVEKSTVAREVIISVDEPAFGPLSRLDHPIVSALACAAAQSVNSPVTVDSIEDTKVTLSAGAETKK